MKRFLFALSIAIATFGIATAPALATNPHHEEQDGCDHGNTGKPCRTDPRTDHGKDCETHGNHGGMNEDHCDEDVTTTTTPSRPTTTTTIPASNTTTTTTSDGNVGSPSTTTMTFTPNTNDSSPIPTPSLGCMTPDGYPYLTNIEQGGCPQAADLNDAVAFPKELAHTGWDAGLLFVIGTAVLLAGLSCWFASFVLPDEE